MISRRFFLKACGAGLLSGAVARPGLAATGHPLARGLVAWHVPAPSGGWIDLLAADGLRLASIPMYVDTLAGVESCSGLARADHPGVASRMAWRLPNGKTVSGTVGCGPEHDFRLDTPYIATGAWIEMSGTGLASGDD